jgi:hypothetical protein
MQGRTKQVHLSVVAQLTFLEPLRLLMMLEVLRCKNLDNFNDGVSRSFTKMNVEIVESVHTSSNDV